MPLTVGNVEKVGGGLQEIVVNGMETVLKPRVPSRFNPAWSRARQAKIYSVSNDSGCFHNKANVSS